MGVRGSTQAWPAFFMIQKYSGKKPSVATVLPTSFSGKSVMLRFHRAASHGGTADEDDRAEEEAEDVASDAGGVMKARAAHRALPGRPL
jgi:hypothetical protein